MSPVSGDHLPGSPLAGAMSHREEREQVHALRSWTHQFLCPGEQTSVVSVVSTTPPAARESAASAAAAASARCATVYGSYSCGSTRPCEHAAIASTRATHPTVATNRRRGLRAALRRITSNRSPPGSSGRCRVCRSDRMSPRRHSSDHGHLRAFRASTRVTSAQPDGRSHMPGAVTTARRPPAESPYESPRDNALA